jgi:hypothetical protein
VRRVLNYSLQLDSAISLYSFGRVLWNVWQLLYSKLRGSPLNIFLVDETVLAISFRLCCDSACLFMQCSWPLLAIDSLTALFLSPSLPVFVQNCVWRLIYVVSRAQYSLNVFMSSSHLFMIDVKSTHQWNCGAFSSIL